MESSVHKRPDELCSRLKDPQNVITSAVMTHNTEENGINQLYSHDSSCMVRKTDIPIRQMKGHTFVAHLLTMLVMLFSITNAELVCHPVFPRPVLQSDCLSSDFCPCFCFTRQICQLDMTSSRTGHLSDSSIFRSNTIDFRQPTELDFRKLGLKVLFPESLKYFRFLIITEIDFSSNNLTRLDDSVFKEYCGVRRINASYNQISFVGVKAFQMHTRCLEVVDLSHNKLLYFDVWPYNVGPYLGMFDVSHNRINQFRNSLEINLIKSRQPNGIKPVIRMDDNNLTSVETFFNQLKIFNDNKSLVFPSGLENLGIVATHNPWICDCNVYRLRKAMDELLPSRLLQNDHDIICQEPATIRGISVWEVDLTAFVCNLTVDCPKECLCQDRPAEDIVYVKCAQTKLTTLPVRLPNKPLVLDLANHSITKLEWREYLFRVKKLDVSNSNVAIITEDAAAALRQVLHLNLRNNHLRTLPRRLQVVPYSAVILTGNPLQCSCDLVWMSSWLTTISMTGVNSDAMRNGPEVRDDSSKIRDDNSVIQCQTDSSQRISVMYIADTLGCNANHKLTNRVLVALVFVLILLVISGIKTIPAMLRSIRRRCINQQNPARQRQRFSEKDSLRGDYIPVKSADTSM